MYEPWLLRAYALTIRGGVRDAGAAEPYLRYLRIPPPSSITWLVASWPELATFATTHDLVPASRARADAAPADAIA